LEGRLDPNDYGIESMVNRQKLEAQGISTEDRSCIDYIYFDSSNNFVSCKVTGMPSWFRIDDEDGHFNTYDITGSTYDC